MKIKKYSEYNFKVPKEIEDLSDIFTSNGKRLYIVGGYVRDTIMGITPLDIDLATDSLPEETMKFLEGKYKMDLVGKAFGVIIVHIGEIKIEIASFRKDTTIGRHPEIKLGVSIEDDVNRRDISISSLFYDIQDGKIVDLVGGISDIKNKIIRMVGNPKDRLQEDQLRSLRCIRFACRYGFKFDTKTKNDLKKYTDLSEISQERIWEEMKKAAKQAKNYSEYLELFNEYDMWGEVFPGAVINTKIEESDSFITYIANLFKFDNISDLEKRMVIEYKIEYDIASKVVFLINLLNLTPESAFDLYKQKIKCHCSTDLIVDWLDLNRIHKKIFIRFIDYVPSVSAEDLIAKGFKGKPLGDEIKRLEIEKFKELIND